MTSLLACPSHATRSGPVLRDPAEQSISRRGMSASAEDTSKYDSLLATGERVLLVRQRHWLTFLEAGRWFVLALVIGLVSGALDRAVPDDGVAGPISTLLGYAFWIALAVGLIGLVWYFLVWRVERYLVTTRRVIEAGGVDQQVHARHLAAGDHRHERGPSVARPDLRLRGDRPADRGRGRNEQDSLPPERGRLQESAPRCQAGARARGWRGPRHAGGGRGAARLSRSPQPGATACRPRSWTTRSAAWRT